MEVAEIGAPLSVESQPVLVERIKNRIAEQMVDCTQHDVATGETDLQGKNMDFVATGETDLQGKKMEVVATGGDDHNEDTSGYIHTLRRESSTASRVQHDDRKLIASRAARSPCPPQSCSGRNARPTPGATPLRTASGATILEVPSSGTT